MALHLVLNCEAVEVVLTFLEVERGLKNGCGSWEALVLKYGCSSWVELVLKSAAAEVVLTSQVAEKCVLLHGPWAEPVLKVAEVVLNLVLKVAEEVVPNLVQDVLEVVLNGVLKVEEQIHPSEEDLLVEDA